MNLNKVFILGNLTRDPELRQTQTGQAVCTFGVATNSFYKDRSGQNQKKAEFHNVVVWGRQAEIVTQFLKKGSQVLVEGKIQTRSWTDNQNQAHKIVEIIGDRIQFGSRPQGGVDFSATKQQDTKENSEAQAPSFDEIPIEELPEINLDEGDIKPENIPF